MYKLTVIAGPNRGTSYAVQDGETTIGRQAGNTVVLQSAKVSKRHCALVVNNDEVQMQDQGSSNGTFVNGVLSKLKRLYPGDRLSVGEYVFELTQSVDRPRAVPAVSGLGNVLQFPGPRGNAGVQAPSAQATNGLGLSGIDPQSSPDQMPRDLKGKLIWIFDYRIMPFFYNLNFKHEWRAIAIGAFGAFAVGNLVLSVYPLVEQNRSNLIRETGKRATILAKQIAERNSPYLAARAETKTEISPTIEGDVGVRLAILTDLDSRVIAPGSKLNQYLTAGTEAPFAIKARDAFKGGRETGVVSELSDSIVCAVEPVKVFNPSAGRNVIVGMAIVSIDAALATPGLGEMGMVYAETLVLTALLGGLILMILYKLTLRPLQTLNEDMDKALKGDIAQVTHEFKFEELNPLWDIINSALQRVPKGGVPGGSMDMGLGSGPSADEYVGPMRMLGGVSKFGLVLCDSDKKILYVNPVFEEISGIRADSAVGQEFGSVARDQSLGLFVQDLMDRAAVGGDGVSEDYDFSGVTHKCHASSFGSVGGTARCYLLAVAKAEG